jgi:hypothetical protein
LAAWERAGAGGSEKDSAASWAAVLVLGAEPGGRERAARPGRGVQVSGGGAGGGGLGGPLLGLAQVGDGFGERGQPTDQQQPCPDRVVG